jgi:SAM-dependent methyltransferase
VAEFRFTGGLPETACGLGSTLRFTEHLRAELPGLLRRLNVWTLLDAPCGDFNWMAQVHLPFMAYTGGDIDPGNLAVAAENAARAGMDGPAFVSFIVLDLMAETPPKAGVMLCRDFLQHLPNAAAIDVLRRFLMSGTPWLLATSHKAEANDDLAEAGGFRPLDLTKHPINLPAPVEVIEDGPGSGRILGLWHRDMIAEALGWR